MKKIYFLITFLISSTLSAQDWNEIVKVVASDRDLADQFGTRVCISGDYAIIGAYAEDEDESGINTIDNAGAAYIFKNDGAGNWAEVQKIVASDRGDGDQFSYSVGISGNYAVIGARLEDHDVSGNNYKNASGAAYIFEMDQDGNWNEVQKIVAPDREADDIFGHAVAISGNYIIVGAYNHVRDVDGNFPYNAAGAAYIFERDNEDVWIQVQKIAASDRSHSDQFGYSVSISGKYAIVGAMQEDHDPAGDNYLSNSGSAYMFKRDQFGVWNEIQKLVASDRGAEDQFGYSVALSGEYAIVGADFEDEDEAGENPLEKAGSAYIFECDADGIWSEVKKLGAPERNTGDRFGWSVSISGNYAISGAFLEDEDENEVNTLNEAGSAYIYERDRTGEWSLRNKIVAGDRAAVDEFGHSVSISGNTALIGAIFEDHDANGGNTLGGAGSAYFFSRDCDPVEGTDQQVACGSFTWIDGNTYTSSNNSATYTFANGSENYCDSIVTLDLTILPEPVGIVKTTTTCSDAILTGFTIETDPGYVAGSTFNISVNSNGLIQSDGTPSAGDGKFENEITDDGWYNDGITPVDVVYTIKPVSLDGCIGNPFNMTVSVDPEPVGITNAFTVCSSEALDYNIVTDGAAVAATTFNISVNSNGLEQSGGTDSNGNAKLSNELVDDIWSNLTLNPVDVIYYISPVSSSGCEGDLFQVTFTIYPEPVGNNDDLSACSSIGLTYDLQNNVDITGSELPSDFNWYAMDNPDVTGESSVPQNSSGIDDILINTTYITQSITYTVIPTGTVGTGCQGDPFTITVNIDPEPVGIDDTDEICSGDALNYNIQETNINGLGNNVNSVFTYTVISSFPDNVAAGPDRILANNVAITDSYNNMSSNPVTITYTITPESDDVGCTGSSFTYSVTVNPITTSMDQQTACGSYTWIDGNTYTEDNNTATYTIMGGAANGCDSIVTLDLTILPVTTGTDQQTACGSYTWIDGNTYTEDNNTATYTIQGGAANGCDSIVALDLTLLPVATGTDQQTACDSYIWIDGNTYTEDNNTATYTIQGGAANGCDSIVTLDLTILPVATGTDQQTACGSFTWIDGNTYTEDNNTATYTIQGGAANGCDSIVALDLTVLSAATGTDQQTVCGSYTWIDGNTYTEDNNTATYTITGGGANGCDSVVFLNLLINDVPDVTVHQESNTLMANESGAVYQWINCENNLLIEGETQQSLTVDVSGDYAVIISKGECSDTSSCSAVTIVGMNMISEEFKENIIVFPNPNNGKLTVDLGTRFTDVTIEIKDIIGHTIWRRRYDYLSKTSIEYSSERGINFVVISLTGTERLVFKTIRH